MSFAARVSSARALPFCAVKEVVLQARCSQAAKCIKIQFTDDFIDSKNFKAPFVATLNIGFIIRYTKRKNLYEQGGCYGSIE